MIKLAHQKLKEIFILEICSFISDNKGLTFSPVCTTLHKVEIEQCKTVEQLTEYAKAMQCERKDFRRLIDEFDTLDDITFLQLLKKFYYLNLFALENKYVGNIKFDNRVEVVVKTDDLAAIKQYDKSKIKDFITMNEWHYLAYRIACDASLKFEDRVYTKEELSQLCQDKKIIVLDKGTIYGEEVDYRTAYNARQNLSKYSLRNFDASKIVDMSHMSKEDRQTTYEKYKSAFKIIREDITKEELEKNYAILCKGAQMRFEYIRLALNAKSQQISNKIHKYEKEIEQINETIKECA